MSVGYDRSIPNGVSPSPDITFSMMGKALVFDPHFVKSYPALDLRTVAKKRPSGCCVKIGCVEMHIHPQIKGNTIVSIRLHMDHINK